MKGQSQKSKSTIRIISKKSEKNHRIQNSVCWDRFCMNFFQFRSPGAYIWRRKANCKNGIFRIYAPAYEKSGVRVYRRSTDLPQIFHRSTIDLWLIYRRSMIDLQWYKPSRLLDLGLRKEFKRLNKQRFARKPPPLFRDS